MSKNRIIERMVEQLPAAMRLPEVGNNGCLFICTMADVYADEWLNNTRYGVANRAHVKQIMDEAKQHFVQIKGGFYVAKFTARDMGDGNYRTTGGELLNTAYLWLLMNDGEKVWEKTRGTYYTSPEVKDSAELLEIAKYVKPIHVVIPDDISEPWTAGKHGVWVK